MTSMLPGLSMLLFAPSGSGGGMGSLAPFLFQIVLIFGIFYFLLLRPQQQQRKQHEAALKALKRGDEVVTAGGVVGEVLHVKESMKDGQQVKAMDDRVTIKSGESRLVVERGRIARIIAPVVNTGPTA